METHDNGILPILLIVSRTDAPGLKVKMTVERNGHVVGAADFQENFFRSLRLREIDDILQEPGSYSLASPFRMHRQVENMGLFRHQPEAKISLDPERMGRFPRGQ